jgi:hypothetical protein
VNLRQRLTRLEQCRVQASAPTYVWLDEQGHIGDDGTDAMRAWVGRAFQEMLATLSPDAVLKMYGFDPRNRPNGRTA